VSECKRCVSDIRRLVLRAGGRGYCRKCDYWEGLPAERCTERPLIRWVCEDCKHFVVWFPQLKEPEREPSLAERFDRFSEKHPFLGWLAVVGSFVLLLYAWIILGQILQR
jgi:hypothetical protein